MSRFLGVALASILASHGAALAGSWESTFTVPDGLPATFELPFPVAHPGQVSVEARWTGPRPLFFGIEGAEKISVARRSGPSPQTIVIEADPKRAGPDVVWKLTIKALVARGGVEGHVTVTVPDDPEVVALREAAKRPPPPTPPPPPPWTVRVEAPKDATASVVELFRAVEGYRAAVAPGAPVDSCSWQQEFLRFAAGARDKLALQAAAPDIATLRYFSRVATAIRAVDELRSSRDPVLAGPVPADREARRDWLMARNDRVRPVERRLDELTELLRRGHAPALEDERWVPRLVACLTASERFFDDRVRLGSEGLAPNRELAEAQWARIVAAGAVFDAFAPYLNEP